MNARLPLAGIRVANFGWGWAGPVTGQTLSRLGAEVYKIESRARIDINRTIPPFAPGHHHDPDCALQNHAGWAGNGSITLDLKHPEAQALARHFVAHCDVVVENFSPGVMDRLGLGHARLAERRPQLVTVSMPAAGRSGPLSHVRTYGMSLSSITGLDSVTGYLDGPPVPMENAYADPLGGILGAFATVLALNWRKRNGRGMHVDCSQQEGVMQLMAPAFMDFVLNGRVARPLGNRHPLAAAAPHGVFRCAGEDRWIAIVVAEDTEWQALVQAMGAPEWSRDPQFAHHAGRVARIEELHRHLGAWTTSHDDRALAAQLQSAGVAATPVLDVGDLLNDPHFRARGTFFEFEHPLGFRETLYGNYVKTRKAAAPQRTGPMIGQDNDHVFRELLGLPAERYQRLVTERIIY